jgi:virulence-associated protein VagC
MPPRPMPTRTKTFLNGRSTAVRIPAEFGIGPGEELVVSRDADGTVRLARAAPFAGFFAAIERMRAEGHDPAREEPFEVPRMGPPRPVALGKRPAPRVRKRRKSR